MNLGKSVLFSAFALGLATTGAKAITVDGTLDAAYGAPTGTVTYDPTAAESNFGSPGTSSDAIGYSIYLLNQGNTLYGFVQSSGQGTPAGTFANLYFGNSAHSTIGFEITNQDVFQPGGVGPFPISTSLLSFATSSDGTGIEFSIADSVFEGPLGSTGINGGFNPGDTVQLRLSQSFGYSVAGPDLGTFTLASAVPEPSTWAMMVLGFAGIGFMAYRRKQRGLSPV
jgi:hypothetical protein